MTDAQLIERHRAGDAGAFTALVHRWQTPFYRFALRYVGDPDDARDACQLALLRIHRSLSTLQQPDRFSSWAYRLLVNICRDELKRRGRRQTTPLSLLDDGDGRDAPSERLPSTEPDAEAILEADDREAVLHHALRQLPDDQRTVVIMKTWQELTFAEIAAILDIPVNTAKSRMFYGLKTLRRLLAGSRPTATRSRHDL